MYPRAPLHQHMLIASPPAHRLPCHHRATVAETMEEPETSQLGDLGKLLRSQNLSFPYCKAIHPQSCEI